MIFYKMQLRPKVAYCRALSAILVIIASAPMASSTSPYQYVRAEQWPQKGWHAPVVSSSPSAEERQDERQDDLFLLATGFNRRQFVDIVTSIVSNPALLTSAGLAAGNAAFTFTSTNDLENKVQDLQKRLDTAEADLSAATSRLAALTSSSSSSSSSSQICTNVLKAKNDLTALLAAGDTAGCPRAGCTNPQLGFTLKTALVANSNPAEYNIAQNVLDTVNTVITRVNAIVSTLTTDITTCT